MTHETSADPGEDYRAVFEAAPDAILLVDPAGTIVRANPQAARLFGYEAGGLTGLPVDTLVPPAIRSSHATHRAGYARHPHTRPMGTGLELAAVRKDGTRIPVEISLSPLPARSGALAGSGPLVIAVVRDLAERLRERGLRIATLNAGEEERRRIARELHDETAQALASVLMSLSALRRRIGDDPMGDEVGALRDRLAEVAEGVRRIARGLRPPVLEDLGLAAALRSYARGILPESALEIAFDGSESALSPEQTLATYRIAQEALSNVAKHARASRIRVTMVRDPFRRERLLTVEDDGVGFDPTRSREADARLGLIGMRERARIAEGTLQVESAPGAGTRVVLRIPDPEGDHGV